MARQIEVGDAVVIRHDRHKLEYAKVYGEAAHAPFVVEAIDRSHGRFAVVGGGILAWRSLCRRVRTKLQRERDAAKAAEATA